MSIRTVVIGGGITGLVAAHELLQRGRTVTLVNSGPLGGMIRTCHVDGFTLEDGPNVLVEKPDLRELVDQLGLRNKVVYPAIEKYKQHVWRRGSAVSVPKKFVPFLQSPLFSLGSKLLLPYRVMRRGQSLPEDESVLSFLSRIIGETAVRDVVDPVLKGIYGGDVESLSARSIFPKLWEAIARGDSVFEYMKNRPKGGSPKIFVFDGGQKTLTSTLEDRLAGRIEVVRGTALALRREPSEWCVELQGGQSIRADGVVLAVAGETLASLLGPLDQGLSSQLREGSYASLTMAHLSVPRSERLIPESFGVLFPKGMPEHLLGVMFKSLVFPQVAPEDKHLISVVVGGAQAKDSLPSADRLERELPKLLNELLGIRGANWLGCTAWPHAVPQFTVGHHRTVSGLDDLEAHYPGLVLAGVDRGGVGVSDRVRCAREATARLCT